MRRQLDPDPQKITVDIPVLENPSDLIVLWEAEQVAVLHVHQVLGTSTPDIHRKF